LGYIERDVVDRENTMEFTVTVEKLHEANPRDGYVADPEEALNLVEELRLQAGKFLYEYPTRLRRTVEVVRRK
jgi:hypothetical protein